MSATEKYFEEALERMAKDFKRRGIATGGTLYALPFNNYKDKQHNYYQIAYNFFTDEFIKKHKWDKLFIIKFFDRLYKEIGGDIVAGNFYFKFYTTDSIQYLIFKVYHTNYFLDFISLEEFEKDAIH